MATIHYLNVKNGDCSAIVHNNGNVSVIDVNNASTPNLKSRGVTTGSDTNQKNFPVNPIEYFAQRNIRSVFRFILTHPDMDHLDGIKEFFEYFSPTNFWDTNNNKGDMDFGGSPYNEEDWEFYKSLRAGQVNGTRRLTLLNGARGKYYNEDENGTSGGNGLYILAPTPALVKYANDNESYNDISYVILYKVSGRRILFGGDADNETWNYLLENCEEDIKDIDLLIAPHHGRKSSCTYEFLRTTRPKMTFFGNTDKASHLATGMFRTLKLPVISNNQGNCLIADVAKGEIYLFVTCKEFAQRINSATSWNSTVGGFFIGTV